ncbi:MAG: hypothetical protein WKH64_04190 [Chloroflexia bacterium]
MGVHRQRRLRRRLRARRCDRQGGAAVSAGSRTHGVALAAGKLYVTNTGDDRLSVIDPVSGRTLATVEVGRSPNGIAVKPPAAGS